ncbi:MAG: nucleoside triphosphate pyrophosphatase [Pseudomonadota bacterium]
MLGSGSPRRKELLGVLGLSPTAIRTPDVDETPQPGEMPRAYCARVTRLKAEALVAAQGEVILCADTTVALGRRILGKAEDAAEARTFLEKLSGRRHQVITAVAVKTREQLWLRDAVSQVRMKRLSAREIDAYLATGDWEGKAGAYGIQGPAGAFIPFISGSYAAIMGLPLVETAHLLRAAGVPVLDVA